MRGDPFPAAGVMSEDTVRAFESVRMLLDHGRLSDPDAWAVERLLYALDAGCPLDELTEKRARRALAALRSSRLGGAS